jgi:peptidyl-prolyl cis-trans isomerase B (cyclophilin B)
MNYTSSAKGDAPKFPRAARAGAREAKIPSVPFARRPEMRKKLIPVFWLLCLLVAETARSQALDVDLNQQAVVTTNKGTFVLSFYPDKAPRHVQLFLSLALQGAYDGTLFHRVVKWGIVQGGDPLTKDGSKKNLWGTGGSRNLHAEISDIPHRRGTLSAVVLPGKADSGGSQFFICVTPQAQLDGQYSGFGYVAEGIEAVDRISEVPSDEKGVPLDPPRIEKIALRPARPVPPPAFSDTPPAELKKYRAALETALGVITLEFLPDVAPNHVRNFLRLAQAGFFDGTAIHRIVPDFVMQGGLLATRQPPLPPFRIEDLVRRLKPEFNDVRHVKGIVSMARSDAPDSAETSFFICLGDAPTLDHEYTVFGKVADGMDVLDKFQKVAVEGETPRERMELSRVTLSTVP